MTKEVQRCLSVEGWMGVDDWCARGLRGGGQTAEAQVDI